MNRLIKRFRKLKWKHIMSLIIILLMLLCFMPGMSMKALAWEGNPYAYYTGTNRTVKFNGMDWYIIKDESTAKNEGTLTLFAKDIIGESSFNRTEGNGNEYHTSKVKFYLDSLTSSGGSFEDVANAIVTIPSLTTNRYNSTQEYDHAEDVKLYLLSKEEFAEITNTYVRKCSGSDTGYWWLRSPAQYLTTVLSVNEETGDVKEEGDNVANNIFGVRPALKLDLSMVIFSNDTGTFNVRNEFYVTLSGGENAVADPKTGTKQTGLTGAMTTVTYEAKSGYHFPRFSDIIINGITVTRTSNTTVTVSGTPTRDTTITIPDAVNNIDVSKGYSDYVNTTRTVMFNDLEWYIISNDSTAADDGTITLLSKEPIETGPFEYTSNKNTYSTSPLKAYLDTFTSEGGSFADVADAIVTIPSLTTYGFNSTEIIDTAENVKLYLLSWEEYNDIHNVFVKKYSKTGSMFNKWWLRTPGKVDSYVMVIDSDGYCYNYDGSNVTLYHAIRPALKLDLSKVIFSSETDIFSMKPVYSVTLSGGLNAVADPSTGTSQTKLTGAMVTVTYEANSGYHFEEFTDITQNGITVTRTSDTTVTVSGTPTADTSITVPDAVEIIIEPTSSPAPSNAPASTPEPTKAPTEATPSPTVTPTAVPTSGKFAEDDISPEKPVKVADIEQTILSINDEKDTKGSTFSLLKVKGTAKSKKSIKLSWSKVPGAEKYMIFGNKCGKKNKYTYITTVTGTSYTAKKLKKGTYYKFTIVAVKGDDAIATSKTIHVVTDGGKKGNNTKVKLSKTKLTLKTGKSKLIKAKLSSKKKVSNHRKVAWESDDLTVVKVNSKGKITAVGKGSCYVYAYAQNGVTAKIKVTVK